MPGKEKKKLDDASQYKKIREDFMRSLSALSEDHARWREYDDFYLGKHWSERRPSWRPDPVINYCAYVIDQKAPQLTNNRPRGLLLPTAQGDEEVANLFTKVTDVVADRVNLDDIIAEVVPTAMLFGIGWFKVYWDNSKSGGRYDPLNPAASTVWKGDICIDAPDPANIYHDPQAHTVEDCRYIIYAVPKTVEWVKEKFGETVDAEQTFETDIYDRPGLHQAKNRVMLYEYWYKENGTINVIYAAGGKILKHIKEVYKHGRYPFVAFVPKKKRKSLIGISELQNIINNQKLLNKFMEMLSSNAMLSANPILLVDSKSGVDPNSFVAKPGVVQPINDITARKPQWLEPPNISSDVPRTIDKLIEVIERIAGLYDAQTGETPSGVTAATALQILIDQGSIPIKGMQRNLYQAVKDVYELMVELMKEFYTEERYFRITEDDGEEKFLAFRAAQYAEIDFDIQISAGSSTPTSKAYIAQLGADLYAAGVLLPSEYVDMQEGLPNKERIVSRLREQEQMGQPQADPMQQQAMMEQQMAMQEQERMRDFQEKAALKQMDNETKLRIAQMNNEYRLLGVR